MKNYAITIKIENNFSNYIRTLQEKLNKDFSINDRLFNSSVPHIMLVAGQSEIKEQILIDKIRLFSQKQKIKSVEFNGFGAFLNISPTIFIRWIKSKELESLYKKSLMFSKTIFSYHHKSCDPKIWLPKTTIATNDTNLEKLNKISEMVVSFKFPKRSNCRYLCFLRFDDKREYLIEKFKINN